jgi:hypothetical protein
MADASISSGTLLVTGFYSASTRSGSASASCEDSTYTTPATGVRLSSAVLAEVCRR